MPRCFVGCFLEAESADALSRRCPDLGTLRRTAPENYHVTLLFAGQVDEAAARALGVLVAGLEGAPTIARVTRIGGFPAGRRARILAAELEPDARVLDWQQALVAGWPAAAEDRPFKAHITLARGRRSEALPEGSEAEITVRLRPPALYESLTLPEGARYRRLAY